MSKKSVRIFSLPPDLQARIQAVLKNRFGMELSDSRRLAECIHKMSDYYIENPWGQTPWHERWCRIAQLIYFMPLNLLRMRAALIEGQRLGFLKDVDSLVDFGSGLGSTALALSGLIPLEKTEVIETSSEALDLARDLGLVFSRVQQPQSRSKSLLSFSYSLTELNELPPWLFEFEKVAILEPSTRQDGRRLLEVRKIFLSKGYSAWAPCPHQEGCPLYEKSPADWCHDRIHFDRPDWWVEIERHLPFQNPTLTFSYLLAAKTPRPLTNETVRIVGDLLKEKGKSRQMICRGPEREFFSWLKRDGEAPEIPRGVLIPEPRDLILVGNELRAQKGT